MIAQISHTSNLAGLVNYHNKKIINGHAEIIGSQHINISSKSNITASFNSYAAFANDKTPHVHISVNFHADDRTKLDETTYNEIAQEYLGKMGYGEQPYLIVKHQDQAHPHFHIITSKIKDNGTKVSTWGERYLSQNISRSIEVKMDLTQVSSIKLEPLKNAVIQTEKEYAKYLRSSVKEALSFKPKRSKDLADLLSARYGISVYTSSKKGMGFAVTDKMSERIQNGFGTKGIGASSLDRRWSGTRIRKQLRENFETAPKRYRNLKGSEKTLNEEVGFFRGIATEDLRAVLEGKNLDVHKKENSFLVLDTKGKNLYSERDFKGVEFQKIGKETKLKDPSTSGLFERMAEETMAHYKQEISPSLKKSVFLDYVAVRNTFLAQVVNSETCMRYEALLSPPERKRLDSFLNDFYTRSLGNTGALKAGEVHGEEMDRKTLVDFAAKHDLDPDQLSDLFELNTYRDHYTHFTVARNTLALIRSLEGSKDEQLSPNLVLQYTRYFECDELLPETAEKLDQTVTDLYVRSKLYELRNSFGSAEGLLRELNASGITLRESEEGSRIFGVVAGHDHNTRLDQLKGIFPTVLLETQKPTASLEDIAFNNAMRSENIRWAYSLYERGKISENLLEKYREYAPFVNIQKEKAFSEAFKEELYTIRREKEFVYESQIREAVKDKPELLSGRLEHLLDDVTRPVLTDLMEKYTSEESLREAVRKEKKRFENQLKIAAATGHAELAGLMGVRTKGSGTAMDYHGGYSRNHNIDIPKRIARLQEEPYFNAYRNVFENATFHMFGDKREYYRRDFGNLLVYESFKSHIPDGLRESYQKLFEKDYIDHFTGISKYSESFSSSRDKIEYLNSKGIRVLDRSGNLEFKMAGSKLSFADEHGQTINNISSDVQIRYLRDHNFTDERTREGQLRFSVAMERGDYIGAAWLLNGNKAVYALSGAEKKARAELEKAMSSLDRKGTAQALLHSASALLGDRGPYDGHYSAKGAKKRKRRFKRRL